MSPKSPKTVKQITAAKKRRSSTLKKLDKLYKKSNGLRDEKEKCDKQWSECLGKINHLELTVTKKKWNQMQKPCNVIYKNNKKLEKQISQLAKKSDALERIAGDIEEMYGIPENASY